MVLYGSDIRYSHSLDKFFIWNGRYWSMDNTGTIFKMAKSMLKRLLSEGEALEESEEEPDGDLKKKVISFAIRSESDGRIKAMVNQTKSQPEVILTDRDTDPFLLNLSNGTLDLKTGILREHSKHDYITRMIDIEYDKNAGCPGWLKFLDKIFLGDESVIDFVQKSVGYSLTGSQDEQCFYMLSGTGANGKTTFLNTIKMIMGDYGDTLKASSLMARQYDDGARGDIAKLKNKRFVVSSELNEGQYFDENLIKCVTGGETLAVRFLYGEEFNLKPEFKIWMGTNDKPRIRGTDLGIWRRVRIIPFLYTFRDEERDKNFMDKVLVPELPGILNWAVEGCLKWQNEGMRVPEKSSEAVSEYRNDMDVVQRFINERCITGNMYTIRVGDLYQNFCSWCSKSGDRPMSGIKFSRKMKEKGFDQYKTVGWYYWRGIGTFKFR